MKIYPWYGTQTCPVCKFDKYRYVSYSEYGWGIVEQHGYCDRCGYTIEQAYSSAVVGFEHPQRKGYRDMNGIYHPSNFRKRRRMRRKFGIKLESEDRYLAMII